MDLLLKYVPSELRGKVGYQVVTSGDNSNITSEYGSRVTIIGDNVTFTLGGGGSKVFTNSSVFVEGIDFKANEEVVVRDGKIIKGMFHRKI
ncbi:MAG: hypothetical protein EKK61_05730 [Rickettsiales bacterium]|nr:MAG: hypothetical protein EKK61_05730 [Rickettsiales bacterium]